MISKELLNFYGLKRNPFGRELCQALQPQNGEELDWYAKVDGFGECVQFIEEWFARPEHLQQRAIIMVYGPKGCGCTSVANYILHYFCRAKQLNMQQLSPLRVMATSHHDMGPVKDALGELYMHLWDLGENLSERHKLLDHWYDKHVLDRSEPSTEHRYKLIFSKSKHILDGRNRTPIIVLDKIRSYEQIEGCAAVFEKAPLILVTTSDPNIRHRFARSQSHGFVVQLRRLTLQDVEEFLAQRWPLFSSSKAHPFSKEGLQSLFQIAKKDDTWPFNQVIHILSEIFTTHLKELEDKMLAAAEVEPISESLFISKYYIGYTGTRYMIQEGIFKRSGDDL